MQKPYIALLAGLLVGASLLLIIGAAPDPTVFNVPGITLGNTNIYRDNGTALTRNGAIYGGGGGGATNLTPWPSDINANTFSLTNATEVNGGGTNVFGALAGKQASGSYITALTGDVTASGPGSAAASLKSTGTAGTYRSVTFDAQGRETSGSNPTTFAGYSLSDTSANLAASLTDETGSGGGGLAVFNQSPTIVTPTIASFANATHNHQNAAGGGTLAEAALALTDVTTANVSTSAHGFAPKAPNDATKYLDGTGAYSVPAGGGGVANPTATISNNSAINGSASTAIRSDGAPGISTTGVFQFGRLGLGAAADATIPLTLEMDALGTTPTSGIALTNTTAAANNAQQVSPSLIWQGRGWGTTGSSNDPVAFRAYVLPVQGTTPTAKWMLDASINGAAFGNAVAVTSGGSVQAGVGSSTATSYGFNGQVNDGLFAVTGGDIGMSVAGTLRFEWFGSAITTDNNTPLALCNATSTADAAILRYGGNQILQLGNNGASATAYTIRSNGARGGTDTDKNGGTLELDGGIATGTGRGGDLIRKTSNTSTTGSTAQTLSTRDYVSAEFVNLTNSGTNLVLNVTCAAANYVGGTLHYTIFASDGTDHQATKGSFAFAAVNKGGTVTPVKQNEVLNPGGAVGEITAASTGTLSSTWTVVANGNGIDFKCAAVSSLTTTVLRAKWALTDIESNDAATVTPQ